MLRTFTAALSVLIVSSAWAADAPQTQTTPMKPVITSLSSLPTAPVKPFVYKSQESDIVSGKQDAPITLVEYASLSCPHCSHFYVHELPELTKRYIDSGKVKLVFRSYPLNDPALKAAELVECAPSDSREAFVKVLFTTQVKWAYDVNYRDALGNIAVIGGIDRLKFESCMGDKAIEKRVLKIAKEASDEYKVNSTPSFFINADTYKGDHSAAGLGKAIDVALAAKAKK